MTRWTLGVIGVVGYALGLIALAPATLVDSVLDRSSEGRLRLAEAQGTFWSGTGHIEVRDEPQRIGVAKRISWYIRPASLLVGELIFQVKIEQAAKHFPVTLSMSGVEVAEAEFTLPASVLGLGVPKLAPLKLTGDLFLRIAHLTLNDKRVSADAILQWRGAGSALSTVAPLGEYELRIEPAGSALRSSLLTVQGPLELQGHGFWANGSRPVFLGHARVAPQNQQQLSPLLRLIAVERGAGRFDFELN